MLEPLPGWDAQSRLEPEVRKKIRLQASVNQRLARESAVMLLLFKKSTDVHLVFIKRSEYEGVHSGQIAFPGGRHEPEDASFEQTALRETQEEIGLKSTDIHIVGKLTSLYIPPSNFNVHPFVGFLNSEPTFYPDPTEVSAVFSVPVRDLMNPEIIQQKTITLGDGSELLVPCYVIDNYTIWGATSMILNEFLEVFRSLK